jgi:hypothetical protein
VQDPLVADDQQRGGEQHEGGQARQAAPAAGDVVAGRVFRGGEAAFGAGAAGVGAALGGRGIVVFLPGFRVDVRRDGDGLLGAAGLRLFRGRAAPGSRTSSSSLPGCRPATRSPGRWEQLIPAAAMNVASPSSPAASASQVARSRLVSSRGGPLPPSSARNPAISAGLQVALARSRGSMILV